MKLSQMINNYIGYIAVIFLCGCQGCPITSPSSSEEDGYSIITYYEDQTVSGIQKVNQLGLKEGVGLRFHNNGVLIDSVGYVGGKMHGKRCEWDSAGNMRYESYYCHGRLLDGFEFADSSLVYKSFGFDEDLLFALELDGNGEVMRQFGSLIKTVIISDSLELDAENVIEFLVATPPGWSCDVNIEVFVDSKVMGRLDKYKPNSCDLVSVRMRVDTLNTSKYVCVAKIAEPESNGLVIDSIEFVVLANGVVEK